MSNAFKAQLPHIGASTTLGWHNDALAQSYMDHILQRARVLLPRRGWRVGVIKEFYPRGASLLGLNVNAGSEVCVRFRVPGKRNEFLPFHEVLCTALHEFTHCVHSRHDRAFWNLYYDLVKECEALEVTMIQQGKQLYPEAAYAPPAAESPRSGASGRAGNSTRGGHRLGGPATRAAAGVGRGRGGGTTLTRSRGGSLIKTVTVPASNNKAATAGTAVAPSGTTTPSAVFPGQGRRLGEGAGLRAYDTAPGFTPTRDALRRILAAAAERRHQQSGRPAPSSSSPSASSPGPDLTCCADSGLRDGDDLGLDDEHDDVPDHVPASQNAVGDSDGSWRCPRCGFGNEAGVSGCQFCANDEDVEEKADRDESEAAVHGPAVKVSRYEHAPSESTLHVDTSVQAPPARNGATADDAVEISDDEDDG